MSEPRPLTFTEEARRRQIVECTVELLAERGHAGTSLSGIAGRAGISKAAVLYHFTSKDAVLEATLTHVLDAFVATVAARMEEAAEPEELLLAYLRGALGHFREHPAHLHVVVETVRRDAGIELGPGSPSGTARWKVVADILEAGQRAGVFRPFDPRTLALVIGGALDSVMIEWLADPSYDLAAAGRELETAVLAAVRRTAGR